MNATTNPTTDRAASTGAPGDAGPDVHGTVQRPWVVVAVREIMVKLRDRNFLLSTGLTLVLLVVGIGFSAFMGARSHDYTVAVASAEGQEIVAAADDALRAEEGALGGGSDTAEAQLLDDADAARAAVADEEVDAALLPAEDGWSIVGRTDVPGALSRALTQAAADTALAQNAAAAGTTVAELTAGSQVSTELLEGTAEQEMLRQIVGFAFAFLFYGAAILFGMTIATSVLEEKQNRVVEILATAIPLRQLLYGKVTGNSLLAFAQIAVYAVVGLVGLTLTGQADDIGWIVAASGWFVAFFVVGFVALAAVWAVVGSMASRSEDLQSSTGPILGVILAALFVGLFAEGTALTVASYVPVVSSIAMPIRMLGGAVPLWEPALSLLVTAAAAYLLLRLAERIYSRAVLQGGTALGWRQALRLEA